MFSIVQTSRSLHLSLHEPSVDVECLHEPQIFRDTIGS